jgi:hypothetical protein
MNQIKPYTPGTQTGSLVNYLMSGEVAKPKVGDGATILCWTDRHAATIVEVSVSGKRVGVVEDEANRVDTNGLSESQEYLFKPGAGPVRYFTLRKNGAYVRQGDSLRGQRLAVGQRSEYRDFSF